MAAPSCKQPIMPATTPRFDDLRPDEVDGIVVELSISPHPRRSGGRRELPRKIIIKRQAHRERPCRGLCYRLPVSGLDVEFLAHTCNKAGCRRTCVGRAHKVYKFESIHSSGVGGKDIPWMHWAARFVKGACLMVIG